MSTTPRPYLVLGATGTVGRHVVNYLANQENVYVRAATRNPSTFKAPNDRVTPVLVDYASPETLEAAFKDVEDFYFAQTQGPELVEEAKKVADIAAKAGAKHVVHIATQATFTIIGREHLEVEEYMKGLGLIVTSIRPTSFTSNLLEMGGSIKAKDSLFLLGGESKVNWVDNRDIGEVSARALLEPSLKGKQLTVTGPEVMNNKRLAELIGEVRGKPVELVSTNEAQLRGVLASRGLHEKVEEKLVDMFIHVMEKGVMDVVAPDVQDITGRPAYPLKQFLEENVAYFKN